MLLNAFDVDPGAAERTVELQVGELVDLGLRADLLVVSARIGVYEPLPGTLIQALRSQYGIELDQMTRELELILPDGAAWVSAPLLWPHGANTLFRRIAVVESPDALTSPLNQPWPVFRQLFSLLAVLPLYGIHCPIVASPLLSAGNQRVAADRLFPDLLELCRNGFRHVPDLERLIVFDRNALALNVLADLIDEELARMVSVRQVIALDSLEPLCTKLLDLLVQFRQLHPQLIEEIDTTELIHLLEGKQVTPVALGMHSRRLAERLVRYNLGWYQCNFFRGLQHLQRRNTLNPWALSCLHQIRVFGNWMGHPSSPHQQRPVNAIDLTSMLAALHCVVDTYPWD